MANPGKYFEDDFRKSISNNEVGLQRLYDVTGGRSGLHYCSDFIAYKYPHEFYLELKSTKGCRMNFNYISKGQYDGLLEKSQIVGLYAGVLINFREVEKTFFVEINTIRALKEAGCKSISYEDAKELGVELEGIKKKVKFIYNVDKLLSVIPKEVGEPWKELKKEN